MQLTQFTNYAFRVLMYAAVADGQPVSVNDIAKAYGISFNHLKKIVITLTERGYLKSSRGRYGGVVLKKRPQDIVIGKVIREFEPSLCIFECFDKKKDQTCPIIHVCQLRVALRQALKDFMKTLDKQTLADLITNDKKLRKLLQI